jgi:hypothetical protein
VDMKDEENDVLLRLPGLAAEYVAMAVEDTGRLRFMNESLDAQG